MGKRGMKTSKSSVWEENSIGAGCWARNIEKRYLSPGTLHSTSSFRPEKASSGQVVGGGSEEEKSWTNDRVFTF